MRLLLSAAIIMGSLQYAQANDQPINKNITLKNLDRAFEMAASELKMMTVIYENECGEKFPAWCSFHGEGALEIRGIANTIDSPPSNITIIYTPDGNPLPFAMNVGLLVSVCEERLKQEERGKIIASIIQVAGGKKKDPVIEGTNCDYAVSNLLGKIRVVAEKAKR